VLDLRRLSTFCDYFVVCDATSSTRIGAISRSIQEALEKHNTGIMHIEGEPESKWVLLDCGDIVVHIFDKETRNFYGLERLWGDAPAVKTEKKKKGRHDPKKKKGKKKA